MRWSEVAPRSWRLGPLALGTRSRRSGDAAERVERFACADAARTRTEGGVGLGLAIVDAIAKAHSGRCTVRSSERGSTFSLVLPGFTPSAPVVIPGLVAAGD